MIINPGKRILINIKMTQETRYPRDMSFVDRQGNLVRPSKTGYLLSRRDILNRLQRKLKISNTWQRRKILTGVYKQLAVSTTGKTAKGEYRDFAEIKDEVTLFLAKYVARALEENGLENPSNRLKRQYGIKGMAIAFFDCPASRERIEEELPSIRENMQIHGELELSLREDFNLFKGDIELFDIAREAREAGIRYSMEARLIGATNKKTADELSAVLNGAYFSELYPQGEKFGRLIFYRDRGKYVSMK